LGMIATDFPPTTYEIVGQMRVILASPRFRKAGVPSAFLALTVRRAIKGQQTLGKHVAEALYREKSTKGKVGDVRVAALNLRKLLRQFYEKEGKYEPVVIKFPEPPEDKTIKLSEGEAYTPLFSHNPENDPLPLRQGFAALERWTYRGLKQAFWIFSGLLGKKPHSLGAALGLVESMCKFAERGWVNPLLMDQYEPCQRLLEKFASIGWDHWRYWAVSAYSHQLRGKSGEEDARRLYAEAIQLDCEAVQGYIPYIDFLLSTGEIDDSLGLAITYLYSHADNVNAYSLYGQALFRAKDWEQARRYLFAALNLDPNNYLAYETLILMLLSQRKFAESVTYLQRLQHLCDTESYEKLVDFILISTGDQILREDIREFLVKENIHRSLLGDFVIVNPFSGN
jgi:tetratricopeptide (TPR) repeat protein